MKIIKIFFALILFLIVLNVSESKAQTDLDVLIFTDTTASFNVPPGTTTIFITVVDSALSGTDSVVAQAIVGSGITYYSSIGVHDLNATATTTYLPVMIPGNGLTKTYSLEAKYIPSGQLRIVRLNEQTDDAYAPKTRLVVNYK